MDTPDLTIFREQYSYYARRLLGDLGLSDLEEPLRSQLLASIERYISQVLSNTLLENLDETALKGINEMLERGAADEEVMTYLVGTIPDIQQKIALALSNAYARMLAETRQLTQTIIQRTQQAGPGAATENTPLDISPEATDTMDYTPPTPPSGIDENPLPNSSSDADGNAADLPPSSGL
jgi:hypothetical protein